MQLENPLRDIYKVPFYEMNEHDIKVHMHNSKIIRGICIVLTN